MKRKNKNSWVQLQYAYITTYFTKQGFIHDRLQTVLSSSEKIYWPTIKPDDVHKLTLIDSGVEKTLASVWMF
jgi:hypothetical protein